MSPAGIWSRLNARISDKPRHFLAGRKARAATASQRQKFQSRIYKRRTHEVRIQPSQAVLGGELLVPTLEGKARLKIPAGTQGGQRFRLRERGLPGVSGKRGDLYVVAQINIPKKVTERERELWSELAKLHGA